MNLRRKFALSLVGFLALAALSWQTLSNDPMTLHETAFGVEVTIRFRTAVLMVLGLFAALTGLSFWRALREERREADSERE